MVSSGLILAESSYLESLFDCLICFLVAIFFCGTSSTPNSLVPDCVVWKGYFASDDTFANACI